MTVLFISPKLQTIRKPMTEVPDDAIATYQTIAEHMITKLWTHIVAIATAVSASNAPSPAFDMQNIVHVPERASRTSTPKFDNICATKLQQLKCPVQSSEFVCPIENIVFHAILYV